MLSTSPTSVSCTTCPFFEDDGEVFSRGLCQCPSQTSRLQLQVTGDRQHQIEERSDADVEYAMTLEEKLESDEQIVADAVAIQADSDGRVYGVWSGSHLLGIVYALSSTWIAYSARGTSRHATVSQTQYALAKSGLV